MNDKMLMYVDDAEYVVIHETCGLEHEYQVIEIARPEWLQTEPHFELLDRISGRIFHCQQSQANPEIIYLGLELQSMQRLELEASPDVENTEIKTPVTVIENEDGVLVENGIVSLLLSSGYNGTGAASCSVPGPVAGMRHRGGKWSGQSYFDTLSPVVATDVVIKESGPLRVQAIFSAIMADEGTYRAIITLDAGQNFAVIEEEFSAFESDQLIWCFAEDDLPAAGYFLDTTPAYETRRLNYFIDQELARLGAWSQQAQLAHSDGFAFEHPGENTIFGAVSLNGGMWRGNRLNHLEAWSRRLRRGDRRTRRLVPPIAKADAVPAPERERIPARDRSECTPCLCWEGWLGTGRRRWALVLCSKEEFQPILENDADGCPLGHFEDVPDLDRFKSRQGLLRKIHIRHGVMPLQRMLEMVYEVSGSSVDQLGYDCYNDFMIHLINPRKDHKCFLPDNISDVMTDYICCRIESFWYGAGSISTNPVSSRRIAPFMVLLENLYDVGKISPELCRTLRAKLIFLAEVMHSPDYYCGMSAMLPQDDPNALDPSLKGMANQNFYTDVINIHATAGLVYRCHPRADIWLNDFIERFSRQLDVHVYPESGVWEESHTYFQHVLMTVLPTVLGLKNMQIHNFMVDARFQKMLNAAIQQITPRDKALGGSRHLVPFGDHAAANWPYNLLWANFATAVESSNKQLAGNLAWMAGECGGKVPEGIIPIPMQWRSAYLNGLGVFFRSMAADGSETLMAMRSGSAWGHHHNDDTSIWLYSYGRMLIGDAGYGDHAAGKMKFDDCGHSRWTLPNASLLNYHWRFNRGWVTDMNLEGCKQYATAVTPGIMTLHERSHSLPLTRQLKHFRSIVMLSGNAFLIIDETEERISSIYNFHLGCTKVAIGADNVVTADYGDMLLKLIALPEISWQRKTNVPGSQTNADMMTAHICADVDGKTGPTAFLIVFGTSRELTWTLKRDGQSFYASGPGSAVEASFVDGQGCCI